MPADAIVEPDSSNTCCNIWKDKYTKLEEKRNALRQAVKLLEQQINKVQAENIHLKKAYEEEKVQKNLNNCGKNDLSSRVCLENEIAVLKSEIFSLRKKKDQSAAKEVELLQIHVSERDSEISKLKELLETEKRKVESERKNALVCKKEASEAYKLVKAEKSRIDEQKKHYSDEAENNKEYGLQLEILKQEADELKLKLATETTMLLDTRKKLEAEKKKAIKEKNRADLEMSKAKDQQRLAEENEKLANGEKDRAENLFQQLERKRCEAEKLRRQVEEILATKKSKEALGAPHRKHNNVETIKKNGRLQSDTLLREADESICFLNSSKFVALNRKMAVEKCEETVVNVPELNKAEDLKDLEVVNKTIPMIEKDHIDQMSVDLEENKRKVEDLYMQLQALMSSRKLTKANDKAFAAENEKMKLLKKQLKFEKMKTKHAKREAKLERSQNIVLKHELARIKLELVHYLHRLDVLSKSFPNDGECMNDLEKAGNVDSIKRFDLQKNPCNRELMQVSDPYKLTQNHLVPRDSYGGNQASSVTGIDSKLKSLLGGNKEQMLHSCAIDSSTASFSDRQLVGSQEKGAFSLSTSTALVEDDLNVQGTRSNFSDEFPRKKCYRNSAVVAENSVRSSLKRDEVRRNDENHRKRKRVPDAVGCDKNVCSGNKILHKQLEEKVFFMHEKRVEKSFRKEEFQLLGIHGNASADRHRFQTLACEEDIERQSLFDHDKIKTKLVGTEFFGDLKMNKQSSQPNELLSNNHAWPEVDMENLEPFLEAVDDDYMKLLDLDNNADEERYRRAIEMPMSPTLPEIHVGSIESLDSDNVKTLVIRSCESFPDNHKLRDVQSYSYDVIDAEIKSNLLKSDVSANTKLINIKEGPVDSLDLKRRDKSTSFDVGFQYRNMKMDITDASVVGKNDMKMDITDPSIVGKKVAKYASEMDLPHAYENILSYCVVFSSIKNDYDVSFVLSSMNNCIARYCAITQKEWAVGKILLALTFEEKLSSSEKACVFFSLLLINYCTTAFDKFKNFFNWNSNSSLDLFRDHMNKVMSGSEMKSIFMELHFLDELLLLVEDFLIAGKIFRCTENKVYSFAPASAYHLMAGGVFLAAISEAIGRVGFLCEVSFNILRMSRYDYSIMLSILHAFAYLGGDKYFNLKDYSLTMNVLKSIVACLKGISSVDAAALTPSIRNVKIYCSSSDRCPFSENVVSIDIVTSFLLGFLQKIVSVRFMPEGVGKSFSPKYSETSKADRFSSLEELHSTLDSICDTSCGLNKHSLLYSQWDSVNNLTLCDIGDVISLIELVGCYTSWSWTCLNVLPQLLKMLESCAVENFNAAIVILLGQLGRFGISAGGYNDTGVVNLRWSLTQFFLRNTSMNAGLSIQIATVSALLCLVSFDFEAMVHDKVNLPVFDSQFSSFDFIKRWFSSLSQKQRDLSFRLLHDAAERGIVLRDAK